MADLSDFNPAFLPLLNAYTGGLDKAGIGYRIDSGYRSPEQQAEIYARSNQGRNFAAAPPWRSFHNYGLAADVIPNNPADYARMHDLARQAGLYDALGGLGFTGYDPPHVEMPGSLSSDVAKYHLANWRPASQPAPTTGAIAYSGPPGVLAEQGPENAGAGAATAAQPGQPMDVRQLVFNKLTGAGLAPHQAMGAIWSLNGESRGLNPGAYNPNDPGGSVGFGQWMGPRRAALEAFAKTRGTAVTDPGTQADFLVDELTNKNAATYQPGVFAKMQGAQTVEDATRVWTSQFERPQKDNSDARIKAGAQAASLDANGNFVLGPGVGANAASAPAVPGATTPVPGTTINSTPVAGSGGIGGQMTQFAKDMKKTLGLPDDDAKGQGQQQIQPLSPPPAPGARNISPLLGGPGGIGQGQVSPAYAQRMAALNQPVTWGSAPPGQMPGTGYGMPVPGTSLMSNMQMLNYPMYMNQMAGAS